MPVFHVKMAAAIQEKKSKTTHFLHVYLNQNHKKS